MPITVSEDAFATEREKLYMGDLPILEVREVRKSFGILDVLKGISFSLFEGDVLAIIGPSGSGKSTLLRGINGLEKIDSGEIRIVGRFLTKNDENGNAVYAPPAVQKELLLKLGLVFQNFHLFPHLSVRQNITEAPVRVLKNDRKAADANAEALLSKLGLDDKADAYPYQLSGGQQQRVSIARALALNPRILCFDEPTSALDPELTGEVLKVMRDLADDKMTMIVVTHEMRFAAEVANHVIFMDEGTVIEEGTPEEIFRQTSEERTRRFLNKINE
jgi:polar amino acid transport system ATP-binding protein